MALEKARLTDTVTRQWFEVLFNPEEYTLDKRISYAEAVVPGVNSPILQFVSGSAKTLSMELFLDTQESGTDVRDGVTRLGALMELNPDLHAPPPAQFTWGQLHFDCVLAQLTERYTVFRPDGIPVRARLQVTFKEYTNVTLEAKQVKRQTADYSRLHLLAQGEDLPAVAQRYYQDPTLWRPIALANAVDDPSALAAGARLLVPQLPYRNPETGEVER